MSANNDKIKIVTTRSLLPVDQQYIIDGLQKLVGDSFELIAPPSYDEDGICSIASDADVLLGPYVTKKILSSATSLKLIQVPWTGMDTFDFSQMKGSAVPVCNSHSNASVVAEIGIGLIFDLAKKLSYHDRKMRKGDWNRGQQPLDLKSKMLSQQKVCIIGYGKIGSKLGEYLKVFGTNVMAVDAAKDSLPKDVEAYSIDEMSVAIEKADMVVLTVPLTSATQGMVNAEFIKAMKDGAYLVTLSRAGIVDEDALYEALMSGKLAGYASDVWWNAPKRGESQSFVSTHNKFEELDQVVLSPHRAGFSENSLPHLDDVIINLAKLIKGEPLINQVAIDNEY